MHEFLGQWEQTMALAASGNRLCFWSAHEDDIHDDEPHWCMIGATCPPNNMQLWSLDGGSPDEFLVNIDCGARNSQGTSATSGGASGSVKVRRETWAKRESVVDCEGKTVHITKEMNVKQPDLPVLVIDGMEIRPLGPDQAKLGTYAGLALYTDGCDWLDSVPNGTKVAEVWFDSAIGKIFLPGIFKDMAGDINTAALGPFGIVEVETAPIGLRVVDGLDEADTHLLMCVAALCAPTFVRPASLNLESGVGRVS
eukprot:TRINITY_DN15201_c0_g1_i2.p1 TRINITY_DN15201_c0_g1~~TRINITY_DN15201_c0_g1_i2.p1  ORF type:complete len:254 (+),score=33.81 TRINITY_DN15201_c0_g1_i2:500-1261(+)